MLELPDEGQDLDSYLAAARSLEAAALCFLNTYSEVLVPGWLGSLHRALAEEGVGLVGATGSWESALSSAPRPLRPLLRRGYDPFPNPHLRTNCFMLSRRLLLSLDWPPAGRKRRALALESGRASLTRQVWSRRLEVLVAGRDGQSWRSGDWATSRTFRSGEQENLLVADNRTRQYLEADAAERAVLARMAWGDGAPAGKDAAPARAV